MLDPHGVFMVVVGGGSSSSSSNGSSHMSCVPALQEQVAHEQQARLHSFWPHGLGPAEQALAILQNCTPASPALELSMRAVQRAVLRFLRRQVMSGSPDRIRDCLSSN